MGTQQLWPGRFRISCSSFHLLLLIIFHEKAQSGFVKVSLSPVILDYTSCCQSFRNSVVICAGLQSCCLELNLKKTNKWTVPTHITPSSRYQHLYLGSFFLINIPGCLQCIVHQEVVWDHKLRLHTSNDKINVGPCVWLQNYGQECRRAARTALLWADIYNQRLTSVTAPRGALSVVITAQMKCIVLPTFSWLFLRIFV